MTIRPGVVLHSGERYYPEGWMWILAFAIKGCEWAVKIAEQEEFRQKVAIHIAVQHSRSFSDGEGI